MSYDPGRRPAVYCPNLETHYTQGPGSSSTRRLADSALAQIAGRVGERAMMRTDNGLSVRIAVLDAKTAYGAVRYLVTPVDGFGEAWIDAGRLTF